MVMTDKVVGYQERDRCKIREGIGRYETVRESVQPATAVDNENEDLRGAVISFRNHL